MTSNVQVATEGAVTTVTLDRPDKKNALTQAMYADLAAALAAAEADDAIHVLCLRGAGGDFTAGHDLNDFQAALAHGGDPQELPVIRLLHAVVDFPKPLVAQVRGNAVGIGTTVLLHCDLVVAATDSRFALPFVTLGVVPEFGSSVLLPRLLGTQRAARLLLLADGFGAATAESLGLASQICEPVALDAVTAALCRRLAGQPAGAVRATRGLLRPAAERRALHEAIDREWAVFQERLGTPEHQAAITAFFARR